jgi:hypothetical protein
MRESRSPVIATSLSPSPSFPPFFFCLYELVVVIYRSLRLPLELSPKGARGVGSGRLGAVPIRPCSTFALVVFSYRSLSLSRICMSLFSNSSALVFLPLLDWSPSINQSINRICCATRNFRIPLLLLLPTQRDAET